MEPSRARKVMFIRRIRTKNGGTIVNAESNKKRCRRSDVSANSEQALNINSDLETKRTRARACASMQRGILNMTDTLLHFKATNETN